MYKVRGTKVVSPYPAQLTPAETRLVFSLSHHFPPEQVFPDLYFPKVNSRTRFTADFANFTLDSMHKAVSGSELVQIDCVAIGDQGIFVFESKDYTGWIFGRADDRNWTQIVQFGQEKYYFSNPIKQNQLHIGALTDFLGSDIPIYSIIVFGNEAVIKTAINPPPNCHILNQSFLRSKLKTFPAKQLSSEKISAMITDLNNHRIIPNAYIRQNHIDDIESVKL